MSCSSVRICLPGRAHAADIGAGKTKLIGRLFIAGPDTRLRIINQTPLIEVLSDELFDLPPRDLVGKSKVSAILVAGDILALEDLLHEKNIELGEIGYMCCKGLLTGGEHIATFLIELI